MSKQWHPLFAHLMRLLVDEYYEVHTEMPVSELPRRGDLLLLRRQAGVTPPFLGLWSFLTEWNVFEFKGPSDSAEEMDLELLIHVGTGLTYRLNEERKTRGEGLLGNNRVSFWYLVPTLGDTFLGEARMRAHLDYEPGGLWRGSVWGHPIRLVAYRDVPVEEDTIPFHLLDSEPSAPRTLGELVLQRHELLTRFATWLQTLQPKLWEEIRSMATIGKERPLIDWEAVSKIANLEEVLRLIPVERAIQNFGMDRVIQTIGVDRVIQTIGQERVIAASETEKLVDELLKRLSVEQLHEVLHRREQKT